MTGDDFSFEEMGEQRYDAKIAEGAEEKIADLALAYFGYNKTVPTYTSSLTATTAPGTATISVATPMTQPKSPDVFDLAEMGVLKVGTFDSNGNMSNWHLTVNVLPPYYPAFMQNSFVMDLGISPNYCVYVRGVYSKHFTNERRAAMGLPAI